MKQEVTNPKVRKAITELKKNPGKANEDFFFASLKDARFITPIILSDKTVSADGKITVNPNSRVQFRLLNGSDGKQYFAAFTDNIEIRKWKDIPGNEFMIMSLKDFDNLLKKEENKDKAVVINPFGESMAITPKLIADLAKPKPVVAPEKVFFTDPKLYPTRMVNAMWDVCNNDERVNKAWFKAKVVNQALSFVVLVDCVEDEDVFDALKEVAVPHAKGMDIEFIGMDHVYANEIISKTAPFFER
ncbi:MAG: enhanced serine sensitivity protein SseB C-terminal domain-containing protein [Erysipelotrichaceae bacterium]|nr:enhanced serine sensitivity protein SseB C-terminal domain-containing protein [Erysipelotrichaceae bacterium]